MNIYLCVCCASSFGLPKDKVGCTSEEQFILRKMLLEFQAQETSYNHFLQICAIFVEMLDDPEVRLLKRKALPYRPLTHLSLSYTNHTTLTTLPIQMVFEKKSKDHLCRSTSSRHYSTSATAMSSLTRSSTVREITQEEGSDRDNDVWALVCKQ
jgi:hypothetical protein